MGTFTVPMQVGDISGQRFIELEALVDTGASDTVVPAHTLNTLGVEIVGRRPYRLADERIEEYPIGQARVRLDGQDLIVLVVFMPGDVTPLLGATTLETFGLAMDPIGKQLVPTPGLLK